MVPDRTLHLRYRQSRSEDILALIVSRHGPMVFRTGLRLLGDRIDADDATQAAFRLLVQRPETFRGSLVDGLYRAGRGSIAERLRSRGRAAATGRTSRPIGLRGELDAALDALSPEHREAVLLRHLEGRSPRDAALLIGCPEAAFEDRSARGLSSLKDALNGRGVPCNLGSLTAFLSGEAAAGHLAAPEVTEPLLRAATAIRPPGPGAAPTRRPAATRPALPAGGLRTLGVALAILVAIVGVTLAPRPSAASRDAAAALVAEAGRTPTPAPAPSDFDRRIDLADGFSSLDGLSANGFGEAPALVGRALRLTDGAPWEARSVFRTRPVEVRAFSTSFRFRAEPGDNAANGFTFCIQAGDPAKVGGNGFLLGYGGLGRSVAVKFDLYGDARDTLADRRPNTTGLYLDGADPDTNQAVELVGSGIELRDGATYRADLDYDGATLRLNLSDVATPTRTFTRAFAVDIPGAVGGPSAFVGFTAGSGHFAAVQDVLGWAYEARSPALDLARRSD